jgi:uncharacterized protein (TIGR02569 family)
MRRTHQGLRHEVPSSHVLDLFAVPSDVRPVPGGSGGSVVAGDLVLSPGRDSRTAQWLNPPLARLALDLDTHRRGLRIAVPVPARDGEWVVDGWGASRYEPDSAACHDVDLLRATARLLHAELDLAFPTRPAAVLRDDRWAVGDQVAFGEPVRMATAVPGTDPRADLLGVLAQRLEAQLEDDDVDLGRDQLVHGDLAGNVLLDASATPVVIDFAPYWRPARWAEAVCVLDAVLWWDAPGHALDEWSTGADAVALLRAAVFRVVSDGPGCRVDRYAEVLAPLLG